MNKLSTRLLWASAAYACLTLVGLSPSANACDEPCKRAQAETQRNVHFPSYLNLKYCSETTQEFLLNTRKSLQRYRDQQLATAHRGGAKNIRQIIIQQQTWLKECDNYMSNLEMGRVFRQAKTTEQLFNAMLSVSEELHKIMQRKNDANEVAQLVTAGAAEKFDRMFALVDQHVQELQMRGLL